MYLLISFISLVLIIMWFSPNEDAIAVLFIEKSRLLFTWFFESSKIMWLETDLLLLLILLNSIFFSYVSSLVKFKFWFLLVIVVGCLRCLIFLIFKAEFKHCEMSNFTLWESFSNLGEIRNLACLESQVVKSILLVEICASLTPCSLI